MGCEFSQNCGGCVYREMDVASYRKQKESAVYHILEKGLGTQNFSFCAPIFIQDGKRRRAALAFSYQKGRLKLGFNASKSHEIVEFSTCLALEKKLNMLLPSLQKLLTDLCAAPVSPVRKNAPEPLLQGDVLLLAADNGIDVVLETKGAFELVHRELVSQFMAQNPSVLRFCLKCPKNDYAEPVVQLAKPQIKIANVPIDVAPAMFLQPSKEGEEVLVGLLKEYLYDINGSVADLFCGIGTFSYALLQNKKNKVLAADLNQSLLFQFQQAANKAMFNNVRIVQRNLFKYPFLKDELENIQAVVLDPPRAGAMAQVQKLAALEKKNRPRQIVYVSCNPHSFVNDAKVLLAGGYDLKEVTMVDQFVFTNHTELVTVFKEGDL